MIVAVHGSPPLQSACQAARFIFLTVGVSTSSWAPMIPFAKTELQLDDAGLGLILLAMGAGGIIGMPLTAYFIHRFTSRNVVLVSGLLMCLSLPTLILAPTPLTLALALFIFGLVVGMMDVSANAQAVVIEERMGRSLMSGFHGLFSIGGLIGSAGVSILLAFGVPVLTCSIIVSIAIAMIVAWQSTYLLRCAEEGDQGDHHFVWPKGAVLFIGLLCFVSFLAEGAMLDWSAVFLKFSRGYEEGIAGLGYSVFSVSMAAGRMSGDKLNEYFGPVRMLQLGGITAGLGYMLAVLLPWGAAGFAGFVMVGLGASNIVPVLFSIAGRLPNTPPRIALSSITTLGFSGLLLGPALIGFVAEASTLPIALAGVAVLLFLISASAERVVFASTR
ncbi:MFS transporter [bacterium]|nr:MFS transporter [bacterium]